MSKTKSDVDIIISGAGPAGLTTAVLLGQAGWRVRVFDRRKLPADKPCGEGIMPPGVAILKSIGVANRIRPDEKHPFHGIRYLTPAGTSVETEFAEGAGWGVRRTGLSRVLLETALELPNVDILEQRSVDRFDITKDGVNVTSGDEHFSCRLLIGADGLHSRIRSQAGLATHPSKKRRLGMRRHFKIRPWSRFVEIHSESGMEAYITPCGPERIGVAFLWEARDASHESGCPEDRFNRMLRRFPCLLKRLTNVRPDSEVMATGPFEQRTRSCITDGVALVGDAGGYRDACTGEGITLAFKQAKALDACLTSMHFRQLRVIRRSDLVNYRRDVKRITYSYKIGTRLLMNVSKHPRLMERFIAALARCPVILQRLLSFNMGEGLKWPGLGNALRFGYHFIRPGTSQLPQ